MKRLGCIYDRICRYDNLLEAFAKVQKGKKNRSDMAEWRLHLEKRLNALLDDLLRMDFRFGDYRVFKVFDPKERNIYAAAVRERIIHHAVINICGWKLENGLIDDSYACRRNKGQLKAVQRAQLFAKRHPWCLKLDIKSYFDSIVQSTMLSILERKIKDTKVLRLFDELLASYETAPGKGIPIGNLTSQYFANLYLDGFDRWVKTDGSRDYVRYMDDMLVFGEQEDLRILKRDAADYLMENLTLTVKQGGWLQPAVHGVDFLGYRVFPGKLLLNHRSKRRFRRKMQALDEALADGLVAESDYQSRATALMAFVAHADTYHLRGKQVI